MSGADGAPSSRPGSLSSTTAPGPAPAWRRYRPPRAPLLVLALLVLAGLALWKVPEWQVAPQRSSLAATPDLSASDRLLLDKELFQAENAARGTLALILGTVGLLLGLGAVWRRFERVSGHEARSQERFTRAVEQLASERADGSPRMETRLAGVYALERIAADSDQAYWPVMEVLTAYLREKAVHSLAAAATGHSRPSADVQAIVGVLGRRRIVPTGGERRLLDLREADLRGANLSGARLDGVILQAARLDGAEATRAVLSRANLREGNLSAAVLSGADLQGAALARANLEGARLNGADLKGADLSGANLRGADLWQANLRGCNLKDADLRGADLSQADLQEAILWRADLQDASLTDAHLEDTHLERANLSGATGLSWEQGNHAFTDENTLLPDYLLGGDQSAEPEALQRPLALEEPPVPVTPPASTHVIVAPAREPEADPKPVGKKLARPRRRRPALVAPPRSV